MAQLNADEKNDVVVMNQPGGVRQNQDVDGKAKDSYSDIYTCSVEIDNNKKELTLQVQNKRTKQIFRDIYTLDKLINCGFNGQQSLKGIQNTIQSAFDNKDGLTLTIS